MLKLEARWHDVHFVVSFAALSNRLTAPSKLEFSRSANPSFNHTRDGVEASCCGLIFWGGKTLGDEVKL